jgi:hypothetical protein
MFEKFEYTESQVHKYLDTAHKDYKLAAKTPEPELAFYACYNVIVKTGMAVCAHNNLRIKSRAGHHIKLIEKLANLLKDENIEMVANKMRSKRNRDLYTGGVIISKRESDYYLNFCQSLLKEADDYILPSRLL